MSAIIEAMLEAANVTAKKYSGCNKAQVGAVIFEYIGESPLLLAYGFNHTYPVSCKDYGCKRVTVYGEDSDKHRLPSDCRAIHAEIDAIADAAHRGVSTEGCSMLVTRYPCEACARAIVAAGIKEVLYAGKQLISEETNAIFGSARVNVIHLESEEK